MSTRGALGALESELEHLGVPLYGYADVSGVFGDEWGEWPRAISLAMALSVESNRKVR